MSPNSDKRGRDHPDQGPVSALPPSTFPCSAVRTDGETQLVSHHCLTSQQLRPWSLVGGAVLEANRTFGRQGRAGASGFCETGLEAYNWVPFPVTYLLSNIPSCEQGSSRSCTMAIPAILMPRTWWSVTSKLEPK